MTNEEITRETIDLMMDIFQEQRMKLVDDESNNFERSVLNSIALTIIYNVISQYSETYHEMLAGCLIMASDLNGSIYGKLLEILKNKGAN